MKISFPVLVVIGALAAMPGVASAAPACSPGQTAGVAPLYCIPPATPAAAAHATSSAGARYLSALTPAALAGKGSVGLSAYASGPGTITIVLTAKLHGKTVVIGSATKTVDGAGATTVALALTKDGKALLRRHKGALKVTLTSTFKPLQGKAAKAKISVTLK